MKNDSYLFEYTAGGKVFNVKVIKSRRKTFCVSLDTASDITVKAPLFSTAASVKSLLDRHSSWLIKKSEKKSTEDSVKQETLSDEEIAYLKKAAKEYIFQKLPYYAQVIGVTYSSFSVKCQKTRWGSCSSKKNLNFNCLLALTPPEVFDYVIVHELCHLKQMNHSKLFKAEVEKIIPDYKAKEKWLRQNGGRILKSAAEK